MKVLQNKFSIFNYVLLATLWTFSGTVPASADLLWDWNYSCSLLTSFSECKGGSGTFTTTELQGSGINSYYLVTGMTGTIEGSTITSLVAPDTIGYNNDNKLTPSGQPWANIGHKITGIDFLVNNDPPIGTNVYQLLSSFQNDYAGYYTQIFGVRGQGPDGFLPYILNTNFSSKEVGEMGLTTVPGLELPEPELPEPSSLLIFATAACLMFGVIRNRKRQL